MSDHSLDLNTSLAPVANLVEELKRAIAQGEILPGQRILPLRKLAQKHQLGFSQVRSAINQLVGLNILTARQGSGIFVTQAPMVNLRPGNILQHGWVALLTDTRGHVYGPLTEDLVEYLHEIDLTPVKFSTKYSNEASLLRVEDRLRQLAENPPRAVVIQAVWPGLMKLLGEVCPPSTRIIMIYNGVPPAKNWHWVGPNFNTMATSIVNHLLTQGHRRIGLLLPGRMQNKVTHPENQRKRTTDHTRLIVGIGHALRNAGLRNALSLHYGNWHKNFDQPQPSPLDDSEIQSVKNWMSQPDPPTAFVGSDYRLVSVLRAAQQLGRKHGKDFQCVGMGNTPWSQAHDFDSVWLREDLMAQRIGEIIQRESGQAEQDTCHIHVPTQLIIRNKQTSDLAIHDGAVAQNRFAESHT